MRRSGIAAPWVAALLFLAGTRGAAAFESYEHILLSNLGLRTALELEGIAVGSSADLQALLPSNEARSFGAVTALADFTHGVSEIFLNDEIPIGLVRRSEDLDWVELDLLRRDRLGFLEAVHANGSHFQQAALDTYWNLHDRALRVARGDRRSFSEEKAGLPGNLFAALLIEAYADHFLQDFHAAGHVVTSRKDLVGFASLALHDRENRQGLWFHLDPSALERLSELLEALSNVLPRPDAAPDFLTVGDVQSLRSQLQGSQGSAATMACRVKLYGDARLRRHPEEVALLVAMTADSIREVVRAARSGDLPQVEGKDCFFEGFLRVEPRSRICGESVQEWGWPRRRGRASESATPEGELELVRIARTRFGEFDLTRKKVGYSWFAPLDLSLVTFSGAWSPAGALEGGSGGVRIETLLSIVQPQVHFWKRGGRKPREPRYFAQQEIVAGVSRRWDDGLSATGFHLRYIYPVSKIDLQVYAGFGKERVNARGRTSWENAAGLGIEVGYGLLYFHLGYERQAVLSESGKQEARGLVGFGTTVMLPRSLFHRRR